MINSIEQNLRRLQKRLHDCKRCLNDGRSFNADLVRRLELLNAEANDILRMLDGYGCDLCQYDMLLEELLKLHKQSHTSITEGETGYSFPLHGKRNTDVFIVYPKIKCEINNGALFIPSSPKSVEDLCAKSENGLLKRHIYLPNQDGTYRDCGTFVFDAQRSKDANGEVWISLIVMQAEGWQRYDKMYILDSLAEYDNTAFNLEQQVNSYRHLGQDFCNRIKVTTLEQWNAAMDKIVANSSHKNVPIIHLEIHGDENGDLVIGDNIVKIQDFLQSMEAVSRRCGAKLLLTLAVCRGLTFFVKIQKTFSNLPCSYVVGSSQPLWSGNIEARFSAFYKELLQDSTTKVDIRRAFKKMQEAFKDQPQKEDEYKDQHFVMMTEGSVYGNTSI